MGNRNWIKSTNTEVLTGVKIGNGVTILSKNPLIRTITHISNSFIISNWNNYNFINLHHNNPSHLSTTIIHSPTITKCKYYYHYIPQTININNINSRLP